MPTSIETPEQPNLVPTVIDVAALPRSADVVLRTSSGSRYVFRVGDRQLEDSGRLIYGTLSGPHSAVAEHAALVGCLTVDQLFSGALCLDAHAIFVILKSSGERAQIVTSKVTEISVV